MYYISFSILVIVAIIFQPIYSHPERILKLIYIDAFVPEDNESIIPIKDIWSLSQLLAKETIIAIVGVLGKNGDLRKKDIKKSEDVSRKHENYSDFRLRQIGYNILNFRLIFLI